MVTPSFWNHVCYNKQSKHLEMPAPMLDDISVIYTEADRI